mmetsp:Transcript_24055/g.56756  ORF Transcript_24055/g.56756 Transcript_24055/m.56756 type:complete len:315 (-) Transcript_24055:65-1009(-)
MNLKPAMDGHKMGLSTGDIEFAGASSCIYSTNCVHAGQPLNEIVFEIGRLQELSILFRQTSVLSVISPILQHIYNLMGGDGYQGTPWVLTGKACDEEKLMAAAKLSNNVMCLSQFNYRKLWMAYVFNNYKYAFIMAEQSRLTIKCSPASFMVYSHHFFEGMTCMALARSPEIKSIKKKKYVRLAIRCLKSMKKANKYCKQNCLNKYLMLEAEFQVLKGDLNTALKLFEKSASISGDEGFVHEQAIAYERAGLAVLYEIENPSRKDDSLSSDAASEYFAKSFSLYQEWGAATKADQMIEKGYIKRHSVIPESLPK